MTIFNGHELKISVGDQSRWSRTYSFLLLEDNIGKRGSVLSFVGHCQKKGKWKSKFTSEALLCIVYVDKLEKVQHSLMGSGKSIN